MNKKSIGIIAVMAAAVAVLTLVFCWQVADAAEGTDWDEMAAVLKAGGTYTLTGNMYAQPDGPLVLENNATLDLNGYELVADGDRSSDEDLFCVRGALTVKSSRDSGTVRANGGRSVIGVDGGRLALDRVYAYGYGTDHIVYSTGGTITCGGGKLFGLTTGEQNGGGMCLLDGSQAELTSGVISRLEGKNGGGVYIDATSSLQTQPDVIIENCFARERGGGIYADVPFEQLSAFMTTYENCDVRDCSDGSSGAETQFEVTGNAWQELKDTVGRGLAYRLTDDITDVQDARVDLMEAGARIDLNGHTLHIDKTESTTPLFHVCDTADLVITDSEGGGLFECADASAILTNDGSVRIDGAVLRGISLDSVITNKADVLLTDARIEGSTENAQTVRSGLVFNDGTGAFEASLTLAGTSVLSGGRNTKGTGGGISTSGDKSVVTLTGQSVIEDCTTTNTGGAAYITGTMQMLDESCIRNCTSSIKGGGVYVTKNASLSLEDESSIRKCTALRYPADWSYGGGIGVAHGGYLTLKDSSVISDCAAERGGAIQSCGEVVMQDDALITDCHAELTNKNRGGAIYNSGVVTMENNARIERCRANMYGGAIACFDNNSLKPAGEAEVLMKDNAAIRSCESDLGGGVYAVNIFNMEGDAVIEDCTGYRYGGGICVGDPDTTTIKANCTLSGRASVRSCKAPQFVSETEAGVYSRGGGIYSGNLGSTISLSDDVVIEKCIAENGGGIYNSGILTTSGNVRISKCRATESTQIDDGDGNNGGGIVNWYKCTLAGNTRIEDCVAGLCGGGVFQRHTLNKLTISENTVIENCTSAREGGGVYCCMGGINMSGDTAVRDCSAQYRGGGVYMRDGTLTMSGNATIEACTTPRSMTEFSYGGGIYISDKRYPAPSVWPSSWAKVHMTEQSSIVECSAEFGGGVANHGEFTMTDDAQLLGNTANCSVGADGNCGGGLWNAYVADLSGNASITECYATRKGGGVFNTIDTKFTMEGASLITDNACFEDGLGGGVYNDAQPGTTTNTVKPTAHPTTFTIYSPDAITGNTPDDVFTAPEMPQDGGTN